VLLLSGLAGRALAENPTGAAVPAAVVLTIEGRVEVARAGQTEWFASATNLALQFGDSLRTGPQSRATLRLSDSSVLRVDERTELEIRSQQEGEGSVLDLESGSSYFFHRSKPSSLQFHTPLISGAIRGTEFNLTAADDGSTSVSLLDGSVSMKNSQGELVLAGGEQGIVSPGQAPRKSAVLNAVNIIQWTLYYPAVLDVDEIGLSAEEQSTLADSLAAYRSGDLLAALDRYPAHFVAASDAARAQRAALLLAVGQVEQAGAVLGSMESPFAQALNKLVAAVKRQELPAAKPPETASGCLAESYYLQSRLQLREALAAARESVKKSPNFGFAWVRVAELEFSMGHRGEAEAALARGLQLSPRNAQALALRGFLFAAENRIRRAEASFDAAIAVDGALANAWLGRGLCKFHEGHYAAGLQDLEVAAALEPNRSELRSYLGKAWDQTHDRVHAEKELGLARKLDPADPTSWLYLSLLDQEYNRDNPAIADLEKSRELNDNRSVYRSRLLLDQDQAVRSANLAAMYRDVGMVDVSAREAASAVDDDYGNYSAHLFLANSYDALRDPNLVNLRYETPWFSQLLVADLLSPVGAVSLSQDVSQQEYSRLFDGDQIGVYSDTEYTSRGAWTQDTSEYGNYGNTGFAFDESYRTDDGYRVNDNLDDLNFTAKFKQQLTPDDSLFFEVNYSAYDSGDLLQYYNQNAADPTLKISETQVPNIFVGYHHEWAPGIHTLLLAGTLQDTFVENDPANNILPVLTFFGPTTITQVNQVPSALNYTSILNAYTAELQQVFETDSQTLILGARYQNGDVTTSSFVERTFGQPTPVNQTIGSDLTRATAYGYYSYRIFKPLLLTAGLSYDHLYYPQNDELAPLSTAETSKNQWSPKLGFRFTPLEHTTIRGVWTRSLGGVFYDASVRLEPTEVAGFNQAFRSLIPESVAGLVPGSKFETFGLALDQDFPTRTYLTVDGEILHSWGDRGIGVLDAMGPFSTVPGNVNESLDYEENSVTVDLNQLVMDEFSLGGSFKASRAAFNDQIPTVPVALSANFSPTANREVNADLEQADLYALFNHPCGFYSKFEALWTAQANDNYASPMPGDDFWQFNAFAGYRLPRRIVDIEVGVVNIANRDYELNPLDLYNDLPRARTFVASLKLNF
jgi:cytochrome c-type biogenesis protein CcmH/NrfG